jgi:hypothetical protein
MFIKLKTTATATFHPTMWGSLYGRHGCLRRSDCRHLLRRLGPGVQEGAAQTEPHEEWPLTYHPIEDTLIVFVDFVVMPADEWQYNATTNSVEFLVIPPEGALVEIGYVIDYGLETTTTALETMTIQRHRDYL